MSNHIYPTTQTRLAGDINSFVAQTQSLLAKADTLKPVLDAIAQDGYAAVAEKYGYADAAEAEAAYNLLAGAIAALKAAAVTQMTSRMG